MKLEAEIKNIKKILVDDENFFQIPDYQRPYSWDKENISDLIDDVITAFLRNDGEHYFCGSLVLVNNESDGRFDIIDGQQRITTFTIIACVFRELYGSVLGKKPLKYISNSIQDEYEESKRKLKFLTNDKYQIDFEETVLKKIDFIDTKNIEKSFPDNRYLQNAHFVKGFLEERIEINKVNIEDFIIWFYESIVLTTIICPSQDSAIQIFNVLNDRGMPLSSIDILKSNLMSKLSSKEDRKAFKTKWEFINSNLKFSNLEIDSMLNTYLYYKITSNPKNRLDKELIEVFSKEGKSSLQIIKEINDFSDSFIEMSNQEDKYIYCLKYLRHKIYWNSILTTALFEKYPDIGKLRELMVAYYYQNWIAGATVARIKQTSFNVLKLVKNNSGIEQIENEFKSNLEKYATTNTFKESIESNTVYGRKWDRAVLLLIEYFSTDEDKNSFIPLGPKLHLEHILPKTLTPSWKENFTSDEIQQWTDSIGNLTLLSLRKNVQAKNNNFEEKKNAYRDKDNVSTSYVITQQVLEENQWNVASLQRRKEELLNKINRKINIF
ncbi:DUF262 domain-containing protein [Flagellimonas flava]|uniref:DUF262 domain-containing protein n=1 Tax=Flagellimonas flava TaxID=570519 RepID=UPI003D660156